MKIMVISTVAIPAPTDGYSGLEMIAAWQTMEFAKAGHDVTLITTKGSEWEGFHPLMQDDKQIGTMNVVGTIDPVWDASYEMDHYRSYKDLLEKDFSGPDSVVIDHTWLCCSYLSKQQFPEMNLLHTHHGMIGFRSAPPTLHPRFLGLSTYHSQYISNVLNIPVRHQHNGIPLVKFPENYDPTSMKGDYLLSLNRITDEKGIHDAIDVAVSTKTKIVIVGDDTRVTSQNYVNQIIERCRHSNGLATYMGLVDNQTKNQLIQRCKAIIACPKPTWIEAFGLYVVEGLAYYKPFLGLANRGYNHGYADIIQNGFNGFLAYSPEDLKQYVSKIDDINIENCRKSVEQRFTKEIMAANYLNMFQKIIDKDESMYW